jgi:hypothetical protein
LPVKGAYLAGKPGFFLVAPIEFALIEFALSVEAYRFFQALNTELRSKYPDAT